MVEICMILHLGRQTLSYSLPAGYSLRWHQQGDRETWQRIQESTGIYDPVAHDLFEREFGQSPALLPERQCFVEDSAGLAVGTATAWIASPDRRPGEGRVHWVAVSPGHQRRGLGRYLTQTACLRLRDLGVDRAYLTTGSRNVAAVQLYLGLGFEPDVRTSSEREAWRSLMDDLEPGFRERLEWLAV